MVRECICRTVSFFCLNASCGFCLKLVQFSWRDKLFWWFLRCLVFWDIVPEPQELLGGVVVVCSISLGFIFHESMKPANGKKKWRTVLYQSVPFASVWGWNPLAKYTQFHAKCPKVKWCFSKWHFFVLVYHCFFHQTLWKKMQTCFHSAQVSAGL